MGQLGFFILILAMIVSLGTVFLFISSKDKKQQWTAGKAGVYAAFGLVTLAVLILEIAILTHNFKIAYVANYTSYDLPFVYLLSGLWAGNAGSLLFWAWLVSICGAVLVARWKDRGKELVPATGAVVMATLSFFLILLVFTANPFKELPAAPEDGFGLNPLLQNPAMVIHPPLLLAGYVILTVPFALGIAALITRKLGEDWLIKARGWAVLAWLLLGAGNLIGAWWAYVELGWGGYWAWDPVENAGLMPWLITTAFLHSMNIQRRRRMFKGWTLGLVIFAFFLTIFGTFLTRSDILKSVHTFGETGLSVFFAIILFIIFFGAYGLLISRRRDIKSENEVEYAVSREGAFLLTNLLLLVSTMIILLTTMYPAFVQASSGEKVEVGTSFFNLVNTPLFMLIITLAGICIVIGWRKASMKELGKDLLIAGIAFALALVITLATGVLPVASIAYALAAFTIVATATQWARELIARRRIKPENNHPRMSTLRFMAVNKIRYGAYLVHISLALIAIGMVGSSLFDIEEQAVLNPGESMTIKDYTLTYEGTEFTGTMTAMKINATVKVYKNDRLVSTLEPHKAIYVKANSTPQEVTEVAIRTTPVEDLYVILADWVGEVLTKPEERTAAFRLLVNPLVVWIWVGGAVLAVGGVICYWPQQEPAPVKTEVPKSTSSTPSPQHPGQQPKKSAQTLPTQPKTSPQSQQRPSRRARRRRARR